MLRISFWSSGILTGNQTIDAGFGHYDLGYWEDENLAFPTRLLRRRAARTRAIQRRSRMGSALKLHMEEKRCEDHQLFFAERWLCPLHAYAKDIASIRAGSCQHPRDRHPGGGDLCWLLCGKDHQHAPVSLSRGYPNRGSGFSVSADNCRHV